jgi:NAD(P)-dependent dehydrogenase (short-subunit alcohol dehydrogenase family)
VIAGAGREIEAATARLFASEGAAVALLDPTESQSQEPAVADGTLQESDEALFIPADVSSEASVAEIIRRTRQTFGRLDVLVTVAGFNRMGRVDSPSVEDWDWVMEGNIKDTLLTIKDTLLTIKHAVPLMKETGEVINLSSVPVYVEADWYAAYHANKGAMLSMTRTLALELAPRNIRANAVSLLGGHPLFG